MQKNKIRINPQENIEKQFLMELTIDSAQEIIFWVNSEGRILYANGTACKSLNYPIDEICRHSIIDFDIELSNSGWSFYWDFIKTDSSKKYPTKLKTNTSDTKAVEANIRYYFSSNSEFAIILYRNYSGKNALLDRDKFHIIIERSLDTIMILDEQLNINFCTNAVTKLLGYDSKEIKSKAFLSFIEPENKAYVSEVIKHTLKGREIVIAEIIVLKFDSQPRYVETNLIPIKTQQNSLMLYLILKDITYKRLTENQINNAIEEYEKVNIEAQKLNQDLEKEINERKKIEKELIEAKAEAEQANRAKSLFLANMSHEIRTPLNAVLGFAEILKEKLADNPMLSEYIEGINTGGRSLLSLINDILDLSKIDAGKLEIQKEPVNIMSLFNEVYQIFITKIQSKGLELKMEIDKNIPQAMELDQTRVRQILFNLVGNAVKFTQNGYISLIARLGSEQIQESCIDLILEVKDTGLGIPRKQQRLIFDPFKQKEGQDTRKYGGTGLGLTITKRLTEIMNGKISVESTIAKGSVFTVFLKNVVLADPNSISTIKKKEPINVRFEEAKVLLVDDSLSSRAVFKGFLNDCNLNLFEAENGKLALKQIKQIQPDLILMDIQMPIMNGFEAAREIKKDITTRFIPIIALSATLIKSQSDNEASNFNDMLLKPVSKENVIKKLIKYLPYKIQKSVEQKGDASEKKKDYAQTFAENLKINKKYVSYIRKDFTRNIDLLNQGLSGFIDIDDTKSLAKEFINIGEKYKIDAFIQFGLDLDYQATSFHLENIKKMMLIIPEFRNMLK